MKHLLVAGLLLVITVLSITPALAQVKGHVRVVDGDTIRVGRELIGLFGIDAPSAKQSCLIGAKRWPCGRRATEALRDFIGQSPVECFGAERDRQGRLLSVCLRDGEELNKWLVSQGWALVYPRGADAYQADEADAKSTKRGLWQGAFVTPWEWRRGKRLKAPPPKRCKIKGTTNSKGEQVYYLPSAQRYPLMQVKKSRGDRWFCSEKEAKDAGWRPSQ